jgi:hypothetical protein
MSLYHTLKLAFEIGRPLTATQLLETAIAHDNHAHELRASHAGALSRIAALEAENAELRKDAERLDWLSQQFVTVRIPLRYGSRECFMGSPDDNDGESVPWDIRARIDAAITGAPK